MDIFDLRVLDAVATHGSFSGAAARLRLSQPSVSSRVAGIERVVGTALFQRDNRGARLTPAGERYLGYVRRVLALLDDGARAAAAERSVMPFRVGLPASYATALAPSLARAAAACEVDLSLRSSHSGELRTALQDGLLDLALVTSGAVPVGLTGHPALSTGIAAVASAVTLPGLDARYAVHRWGAAADQIVGVLLGRGVPRRQLTVVSPAAAATSLAMNCGHIAVLPLLTVLPDLDAGRLHQVDVPLPQLTLALDWLYPNRSAYEPIRAFLEQIGLDSTLSSAAPAPASR